MKLSKKSVFLPALALGLMASSAFAGVTNKDTHSEEIQQQVILNPQPVALPQPIGMPDDGMPTWYKALCAGIMGAILSSAPLKPGFNEPIEAKVVKFTFGSILGYFMLHQIDQILK